MQTLGVANQTPQSDSRIKNIFWPTIRTGTDVDTLGSQGYWICVIIAALSLVLSLFTGQWLAAIVGVMVYYVGGVGIRQHSIFAAAMVFTTFLLNLIASSLAGILGLEFVVQVLVCVVLLATLRGTWIASFWEKREGVAEMPPRFNETWGDKFVDKFPIWFWPKIRIAYYIYSALFLAFLTLGLAVVVAQRSGLLPRTIAPIHVRQ